MQQPQPRSESLIDQIRRVDASRADYPGEHLIVLGIGALLLWKAATGRSLLGRAVVGALGGALIGRAASGTGGAARVAQLLRDRPR